MLMRNDNPVLQSAITPAGRRSDSPPQGCSASPYPGARGLGPRIVALALHAPPWTYVVLTFAGLTAALLLAAVRA
jgi:hypothetical protein